MTNITQKQLIESLKQLKEIKPRKEWAVLLKSQILSPYTKVAIKVTKRVELEVPVKQAKSIGIMDILSFVFAPKKLVYSFAAVLFLVVGIFGFAQYTVPGDLLFPVKRIAEQSQAALTGQTGLKQDVATLNSRINDLVQVAKEGRTDNIPSAISEVNANMSALAKNLKNSSVKDLQTLKEMANNYKVLASIPGTDLTESQGVKDVYQPLAQCQIADWEKTTLTESQQKTLTEAKDLYSQGKYGEAFEILLNPPIINK